MVTKTNLLVPANIGIIGYGIVGQALAYGFEQTSNDQDIIRFYDKFKDSLPLQEVVEKSEFIFICLPTPMKSDESGIDLSIIAENIDQIVKWTDKTDKIIIIKSTVIPGSTKRIAQRYPHSNFVFNPEFLTEANFLQDFLNADRTIIGADNDLVSRRVTSLFRNRFSNSRIFQTDPTTAEMVKYFANNFLAFKVTFANIFYDLCQGVGINYEEVKNLAIADPRIGPSHLIVTSARGFGGKCFPKDMVALLGLGKSLGVDMEVLEKVWQYNKKIRAVHDWEDIPFVVESGKKRKS